jgi:hypothetical protein
MTVNVSIARVVRLDLLVQFDDATTHPEDQVILVSSTSYATDSSPEKADGRGLGGRVGLGARAELLGLVILTSGKSVVVNDVVVVR